MKLRLLFFIIICGTAVPYAVGERQEAGVKTNLIYDALLNANIGIELPLADRWTLDISGNYNGWILSHGRKWKHWLVQPEARYWMKQSYRGHFFALHGLGGQFNVSFGGDRKQGWGIGAGVGYGHTWRLSRHWGLEAEIAAGYVYYSYDKYPCASCGRKTASRNRHWLGPTKAALNVVYYFGGGRPKEIEAEISPLMPVVREMPDSVSTPSPEPLLPIITTEPVKRTVTEALCGTARVKYPVNSTVLDPEFGDNNNELISIINKLDSITRSNGMSLTSIEFTGYASPEGRYDRNARLAMERTISMKEYIRNATDLPDSMISVKYVAEDWAGLRAALTGTDLPDKEIIIDIIDRDMDPDLKEAALKRYPAAWRIMQHNIFPALRRTEYRIEYHHSYEIFTNQ